MVDRAALMLLSDEAKVIEGEIAALHEMLTTSTAPGVAPVGVRGNLVDADGFPRGDVEVHAIRIARHALACKQTDHKALMKRIEAGLLAAHAGRLSPPPRRAPLPSASPSSAAVGESSSALPPVQRGSLAVAPFASVESVAEGSPALSAGLAIGDLILQFGAVDRTNEPWLGLAAVGELVAARVGTPIDVVVERAGERCVMALTPQTWSGRGLLGCHIVPV